MSNKTKHILSFSGGKDSTFLLLELIRRNYPLDEAVFFDTGWEFPVMYEHIKKCKKICEQHGIKFVTLHPEKSFNYLMFETKVNEKGGGTHFGYSWCGGNCRWGTTLKLKALDKYTQENKGSVVYIGIAADETARLEKERAEYKTFPLAEWGISEAECLQGCYAVWEELKEYQRRTDRPYKGEGKSVFDLEKRFKFEDERTAAGLPINNKEFREKLKEVLIND